MLKHLPPAYFALVMATGIVSIAAHDFQLSVLAAGLFTFNLVAYAVLTGLTVLRAICYPRLFFADMTDHRLGPGFFTAVAGSCILGTQILLMTHSMALATVLLALGVALWIGLTYTIFTAFTVKRHKPPLEEGLTGAWLIAVVATQSIAVLAALIARHWPQPHRLELNFFALSMWLWGGVFCIRIVSLVFYHYNFFAFSPGDLTPPYWINMGAMAISTLAGARLVQNTAECAVPGLPAAVPQGVHGVLLGHRDVVDSHAAGAGHLAARVPAVSAALRSAVYDPLYWRAVLPLGMYTVATRHMAAALDLPFLDPLRPVVFVLALAAWTLTFVGLPWELRKFVVPRPR